MLFPSNESCGAGEVRIPVGPLTGARIAGELNVESPDGSTPTALSLAAAHTELGTGVVGPDATRSPKFVLLVTDGKPNCSECPASDPACSSGSGMGTDQRAVEASVAAIASMAGDGIQTYVVGYDTVSDADLSSTMDMMAAAGGTGDVQHRPVEDSASLLTTFEEIAGQAVSCTFSLDESPPDPTHVLVTVDGQQVDLDHPDGWRLSADGMTIELQGKACNTLRATGDHTLNVEVKCAAVRVE